MAQLYDIDATRVHEATVADIREWVAACDDISKLLMLRRAEDEYDQRITAFRAINDRLATLGVHPAYEVLGVRAASDDVWEYTTASGGAVHATPDTVVLAPAHPVVMDAIADGDLQTVSWRGSVGETARTARSDDVEYPPDPNGSDGGPDAGDEPDTTTTTTTTDT